MFPFDDVIMLLADLRSDVAVLVLYMLQLTAVTYYMTQHAKRLL